MSFECGKSHACAAERRQSNSDSHLIDQLLGPITNAYAEGILNNDWLSDAILALGNKQSLAVGNPQIRDAWIERKAFQLGAGGGRLLDMSAGNKPYERVFRRAGFSDSSSEFSGNTELVDSLRGELEKKDEAKLKAKHTYLSHDITNTTAPSDYFDVAVLTEVLEHLPEPLRAIEELARVVKPDGHILVTAPFTSGSHQQPFHFSSGYSREWYAFAAQKFSLRVLEMSSQGNFFKLMAQEARRVYSCGTPPPHKFSPLLASIHQTFYDYALIKSEHNNASTAPCYDQFSIGWMVHFQKVASDSEA